MEVLSAHRRDKGSARKKIEGEGDAEQRCELLGPKREGKRGNKAGDSLQRSWRSEPCLDIVRPKDEVGQTYNVEFGFDETE